MPDFDLRWRPQAHQEPVLTSTAENILVGGMRGGSKTNTLAGITATFARNHPGVEIVLLREDLEDLKKTTLRELLKILPADPRQMRHHQTDKYIDVRSVIPHIWSRVWYVEGKDPQSLLSSNIAMIVADEADKVPQVTITHLRGALRQAYPQEIWDKTNPLTGREFGEFPPYHTVLGSNPAPCWLMDEFPVTRREQAWWAAARWGPSPDDARKLLDPDWAYFPMSAKDNAYNPPGYWERIVATYRHDPILLARYAYGVWEVAIQGLVYTLERHHRWNGRAPGDRLYRRDVPVVLGVDPSNGAGTYAAVVCQIIDGRCHQVDEWAKEAGMDEDLADWLGQQPYADDVSDVVADSAKPDSIKRLRRLGLPARKCRRKEVIAQINALRALMQVEAIDQRPGYIMDEARCPRTKEEFGKRAYAAPNRLDPDLRVPERPVKKYDHCLNALEYLVVDKLPVARAGGRLYRDPVQEVGRKFVPIRDETPRPFHPLNLEPEAPELPPPSPRYRPPLVPGQRRDYRWTLREGLA